MYKEISDNEIKSHINYKKLLRDLGLFTGGYDIDNKTGEWHNKVPFSPLYNTEEEFNRDRENVCNTLADGEKVPSDLYNKVKETVNYLREHYDYDPLS
ncbi:MAG: hypothetical protein IJ593_10655 [Lachnospiraceae bacterium]|nr:hypothetical protein [Lachnospiraceae bacterium]